MNKLILNGWGLLNAMLACGRPCGVVAPHRVRPASHARRR